MKYSLIKGAAALLLLLCFLSPITVSSADQGLLEREIASTAGAVKETANSSLITGDEWTVLALDAAGVPFDRQAYIDDAEKNGVSLGDTVERQRAALALAALGQIDTDFVKETPDKTVNSKNGIMSFIFGLHLANNGITGALSADDIISELENRKNDDGGWCVGGKFSDVDVTAMAVAALAPNKSSPAALNLIDGALRFLSSRQEESGGFSSYGVENAESSAQVIIALAALGRDPDGDHDFTKNMHTVYDALSTFREPDGTYRHTADGNTNKTATIQALLALVAYKRSLDASPPLFVFDRGETPAPDADIEVTPSDKTPSSTAPETERTPDIDQDQTPQTYAPYKLIAASVIIAVAAVIMVVMFIRRDRDMRDYLIVILIAALAVAAVFFINIESPGEHFTSHQSGVETAGTVTISADASAVAGQGNAVPANGVIMAAREVGISDGDTVYTATVEAARREGIIIATDAAGSYIRTIDGISERDFGALSGWVYRVNGEYPAVACTDYVLSPGDTVEWIYTLKPLSAQ